MNICYYYTEYMVCLNVVYWYAIYCSVVLYFIFTDCLLLVALLASITNEEHQSMLTTGFYLVLYRRYF